jgi:hypothetical protein
MQSMESGTHVAVGIGAKVDRTFGEDIVVSDDPEGVFGPGSIDFYGSRKVACRGLIEGITMKMNLGL